MTQFLARNWFFFALATVLIVGICWSESLQPLAEVKQIRYGIVATVMFLMALPLEASAVWEALRRPGPALMACLINFVGIPLIAWPAAMLLSGDLQGGLFVAATTPCTLASASVWTRRAGGNDAVSILVTVLTNLVCFVVTPLWLYWMTGQQGEVRVGEMIVKLGLLVVLPMALAQLCRLSKNVALFTTRRKSELGMVAMCGVLSMIFMGSIQVGTQLQAGEGIGSQWFNFVMMVVLVLGIHTFTLFAGLKLAKLAGFRRADQIAVGIAGSQKTLMVGLQMAMELNLSILPMVVYHVGQLLLDTVIAARLRKADESASSEEESGQSGKSVNPRT